MGSVTIINYYQQSTPHHQLSIHVHDPPPQQETIIVDKCKKSKFHSTFETGFDGLINYSG